jgi:hypothetical protein
MEKRSTRKKRATPASQARPVLQFRVHEGLYESLRDEAVKNRLTISEQAAEVLSTAISEKELFPGIQKIMMLLASAFWHAAMMAAVEKGIAHDFSRATDWLGDPDCYRAGVLAVVRTLTDAPVIASPTEKAKTLEAIIGRAFPAD